MEFNFNDARSKVAAKAEADWFANNTAIKKETMSREDRDALRAFVGHAVEALVETLEPAATITVTVRDSSAEVSDAWFGGSITVYRPSREYNFNYREGSSDPEYIIAPGYMNASSWSAGHSNAMSRTVRSVQRELQNRHRMLAIATELLNQYNAVILEWERVENPYFEINGVREENKRLLNAEAERVKAAKARKQARRS
jgi:uncharacterized small protein (DUF1192 family)